MEAPPSAPLRVLHVINTGEVGGGAEHLIQLTRALGAHRIESRVIVGRDGPAVERLRAGGIGVDVLGSMRLGSPFRLAAAFRRQRPDLVHLHGSRSAFTGMLARGAASPAPVVYTAHAFSFRRRLPAPLPWLAARMESWVCGRAAAVICLTRGDRDAAAARGVPTGRFTVIPNGIEIDRFPAGSDRRGELGVDAGTPVVGMIARLVPQKDPLAFVRIAERVAAELPGARFVLVGDGPLRSDVEAAGAQLIAARRLVITGFRSDVPEWLATLDLVVAPSLWEGLPLALLEAMAARRAVVASALPGHAEVIEPGVNGILAPAGDPERFAAEVVALLRDPPRREALGRQARERVERSFTVERMAAETAALYRTARSGVTERRPERGRGDPLAPRPRHSA